MTEITQFISGQPLRMESDQEESVKGLLGPLVERILYTFKDEKNA